MFSLFNLIFSIFAMTLRTIFEITLDSIEYGPLYGLYVIATLIPGLVVSVRRLQDVGKSVWMLLNVFIPNWNKMANSFGGNRQYLR